MPRPKKTQRGRPKGSKNKTAKTQMASTMPEMCMDDVMVPSYRRVAKTENGACDSRTCMVQLQKVIWDSLQCTFNKTIPAGELRGVLMQATTVLNAIDPEQTTPTMTA